MAVDMQIAEGMQGTEEAVPQEGALRLAADVFLENKLALASAIMIVLIVLFCFVGPHIYHTDQIHTNISNANQSPSRAHLLGTDDVGYDQLGRLMVGGQTSLEVALGAAAVAVVFGVLWGAISGYLGGLVGTGEFFRDLHVDGHRAQPLV